MYRTGCIIICGQFRGVKSSQNRVYHCIINYGQLRGGKRRQNRVYNKFAGLLCRTRDPGGCNKYIYVLIGAIQQTEGGGAVRINHPRLSHFPFCLSKLIVFSQTWSFLNILTFFIQICTEMASQKVLGYWVCVRFKPNPQFQYVSRSHLGMPDFGNSPVSRDLCPNFFPRETNTQTPDNM